MLESNGCLSWGVPCALKTAFTACAAAWQLHRLHNSYMVPVRASGVLTLKQLIINSALSMEPFDLAERVAPGPEDCAMYADSI